MNACPNSQKEIEIYREGKVSSGHKNDCLILLGYSVLLILSVITIWIFKHKQLRFVHETGFSFIYGLILGLILYSISSSQETPSVTLPLPKHPTQNCTNQYPPDDIIIKMNYDMPNLNNSDLYFAYSYKHSIKSSNRTIKELGTKATFDSEIFFNLLLPPIIFCAGYNMKKKHFFENFGAIVTFAVIGTMISAFAIGGLSYGLVQLVPSLTGIMGFQDCLIFGSFISATDPVTVLAIFNDLAVEVDLYAIVFGESVLNDAVAIVLAEAVEKYGGTSAGGSTFSGIELLMSIKLFLTVFLGALSIGCLVGIITALMTKYTYIREHALLETTLFFLMSYCSFLTAESIGWSGIVASLFCGITQAHYTYNNLSEESQRWTKELFELLSFLMENFVFVYIGVSSITFRDQTWDVSFVFIALFSIIIGRALNVYILSALLNLGRSRRIDFRYQNMLMFAGLRGAMAFALSIRNTSTPSRQIFFTATLVIVAVTVFFCGGLTKNMVGWLKIRMGKECETTPTTPEPINDANVMSEQLLDSSERHKKKALLIRLFSELDCKYIKPLLTHSPPLLIESCPHCCLPVTGLMTTQEQYSRNSRLRASENNFSLENTTSSSRVVVGSGDMKGVGDGCDKLAGSNGAGAGGGGGVHQFQKKKERDSDLELILSDQDELDDIEEADMSDGRNNGGAGLYLQVPLYESSPPSMI